MAQRGALYENTTKGRCMATEDVDKLRRFVDLEAASLDTSEEWPTERTGQAAVDLMLESERVARMQFVADSIAGELAVRRSMFLVEATAIQAILDTHPTPRPYPPKGLERPSIETRLQQFEYVQNYEDALDLAGREPAFTLWFEPYEHGFTLLNWVERSRSMVASTCGRHASMISRSARTLTYGYGLPHYFRDLIRRGVISNVLPDGELTGLVVANPVAFFEDAEGITNFGAKSVVATLCIADMQRGEREARSK